MSVALALRSFLRTNGSRLLLLEDDACAASSMLYAQPLLERLASTSAWSIVKLGHCGHKERAADGKGWLFEANDGCLDTSQEPLPAAASSARAPPTLLPGLGRSFCAHALAVDRQGAQRLLRLAWPYTSLFDEILFALGGGHGEPAQRAALETAGLNVTSHNAIDDLRSLHTTASIFAQRSKDPEVRKRADPAFASLTAAQNPFGPGAMITSRALR